jgi:hypothetical protein
LINIKGGGKMPKVIAIEIAEKKATMKLMTKDCKTVEEVEKKIDEYFDTVAQYAKELDEK